VLEARFGPRVEADVKNDLIQQGYRSAITEHGIQPVSEPSLSTAGEIDAAEGFQFTITVDVRPVVTLTKYTGLDVVNPKVVIEPDELDARVKSRVESEAKLTEVTDRPLARGDLAMVELEVTDGEGHVVAAEPGTMIRTEDDPYYPGVEALLEGLSIGEERTGEVAFRGDARM
jgi:trigger factor